MSTIELFLSNSFYHSISSEGYVQKKTDTTPSNPAGATPPSIAQLATTGSGEHKQNSEVLGSTATNSEVLGSKATNSEVLGSKATNSEVLGSKATNSEVLGSKATNIEVLGSKATNSEVLGSKATNIEVLGSKAANLNEADILANKEILITEVPTSL